VAAAAHTGAPIRAAVSVAPPPDMRGRAPPGRAWYPRAEERDVPLVGCRRTCEGPPHETAAATVGATVAAGWRCAMTYVRRTPDTPPGTRTTRPPRASGLAGPVLPPRRRWPVPGPPRPAADPAENGGPHYS